MLGVVVGGLGHCRRMRLSSLCLWGRIPPLFGSHLFCWFEARPVSRFIKKKNCWRPCQLHRPCHVTPWGPRNSELPFTILKFSTCWQCIIMPAAKNTVGVALIMSAGLRASRKNNKLTFWVPMFSLRIVFLVRLADTPVGNKNRKKVCPLR